MTTSSDTGQRQDGAVGSRIGPEVSVITPTYNRAAILPHAIRSVLYQDMPNFEHIIVDDGSDDDTPAVVRLFASERRLRYLRTPNRGQPSALNLGLHAARGPLVAFLDSDDEYEPNHLSLLSRELRQNACDFVLGRFTVVDCSDDPDPTVADFYNPGRHISIHEIECITGVLFGWRDVFLAMGGFRDRKFADTDLLQRMRAAGYSEGRGTSPTYRYYFGRCADSLAIRESAEDQPR